jgi:hypothetical protein
MREIPEGNYNHDWIMNNPIPAQCVKCKRHFIDGDVIRIFDGEKTVARICNDAIRAPSLENCLCFYCNGKLRPLDKKSYEARLMDLHSHLEVSVRNYQPRLF